MLGEMISCFLPEDKKNIKEADKRSEIKEYQAVEEAAMKFVKSVA